MIRFDQQQLENLLSLSGHCDFAELFFERTQTTSISLENNVLEKIRSGIDSGTGFRIIDQGKTYYGFVNSHDEQDIKRLIKTVAGAIKGQQKSFTLIPLTAQYIPTWQCLPSKIDLNQKISYVSAANESARKYDKRIIQAAVRYGDTVQDVLIANTNSTLARDRRIRTRLIVEAIAKDKKNMQTGYEAVASTKGLEIFSEQKPEAIARIAAQRAIINLEADPAPAGTMTVVLAGSAGGTMVHEACGHALEADFIYKKTSIFADTLGKQIVSPLITVVDDGTLPGHYGSASFDDEGTLTKKNILIENGIVRNFMNDYLYGNFLGHALTGNGRRESYRYTPIPRMTNTYIQPGTHEYSDILGSVKHGLLVKKMGGGQVDITNGNFVFEVTEGYLIKNGKQGHSVRGATLVGNGVEVLKSVDMVGNDVCFIPGTCGKGQAASVTDGQPSLRIPQLIVGGQQ